MGIHRGIDTMNLLIILVYKYKFYIKIINKKYFDLFRKIYISLNLYTGMIF